ncbi:hypothetical protein HCQ94_04645 [Actinomyces sp. zg-332]|uniref:hypothetical protein n=1 Tax=Actinomyces sp. zg-332 TaxID=2708340 RepID=UPI00141F1FD3|nr:hypothetical protein [Actinomyces sp. zg-332]QPK93876.1 hypothetical protein HCQ94_04645 [Actinomyces sp. zg-332]
MNISIVAIKQNVDSMKNIFSERGHEVQIFSDKVDFISCFDSDLLVVISNADLDAISHFFEDNRLAILIERRLCGGKKVLCIGNASNIVFSGNNFLQNYPDLPAQMRKSYGEIKFIDQWQASSSSYVYSGQVQVKKVEEKHNFLAENETVNCKNQLLVFQHPALNLDCKYTQPPNVAWGEVLQQKVILSVENGALSALLFTPTERDFERILPFFEGK